MKPDLYGLEAVDDSGKYATVVHPESEIGRAWTEKGRGHDRLFSAETIVEQLEEWLADLEENGMSAQCSLRVEMKVKDELELLEDSDDETTGESE